MLCTKHEYNRDVIIYKGYISFNELQYKTFLYRNVSLQLYLHSQTLYI